MASPNDQQSPERGYPLPDKNFAGPTSRAIGPERTPSFAFSVSPSPSFRYQDLPPTPPPMYRNALLQDHRRRQFRNSNTPITATTSSSSGKFVTCLCSACLVLLFMVTIISIPITVFYVFGPCAPIFSVEQVSIYNPIFYESTTDFSTMINITMKVNNPARGIGVFYENDNFVVARYSGIRLCGGVIPPSFHRPMEDIFIQSSLTGIGVVVKDDVKHKLEADHRNGRVPLTVDMMGFVRYKMGSLTTKALLKVSCYLVLENLRSNNSPDIISRRCDSIAGFWFATIRNY